MDESKVKGDVFLKVTEYVSRKWGKVGLSKLGVSPNTYKAEVWYRLEDFTDLLSGISETLTDSPTAISGLGRSTIVDDDRWKWAFREKDPLAVFSSSSRQNAQYQVGELNVIESSPGFVRIQMTMWTLDENTKAIWSDFYQGRLQGVLDLTGAVGNVEKKAKVVDGIRDTVFAIFWM